MVASSSVWIGLTVVGPSLVRIIEWRTDLGFASISVDVKFFKYLFKYGGNPSIVVVF